MNETIFQHWFEGFKCVYIEAILIYREFVYIVIFKNGKCIRRIIFMKKKLRWVFESILRKCWVIFPG